MRIQLLTALCVLFALSSCTRDNVPVDPKMRNQLLERNARQKAEEAAQTEEEEAALKEAVNEFLQQKPQKIGRVGKVRPLTASDVATVMVENYAETGEIEPIIAGGKLLYPYGLTPAKVICAPLIVCDIELEKGEEIQGIVTGDSTRWAIESLNSDDPKHPIPHIVVKPFYADLETNIIVTTTRRTYNIMLSSIDSGETTPVIGYYYPHEILKNKRQEKIKKTVVRQEEDAIPEPTKVNVNTLNFEYSVTAHGREGARFKPINVFDDGKKVYVRMSDTISATEAPVFFIVGADGKEIANYRYKEPFYIIDKLFDKGVLVLGTNKNVVTITRKQGL